MNTNTSNLFLNVLDEPRQQVLTQLDLLPKHWYLGGGTALALQLNHRYSLDFDFFSQKKVEPTLRKKMVDLFGNDIHFTMDSPEQITFFNHENIKITLAQTPYKPLYPLISTLPVTMESMQDIAADKAFTIGRRGAFRDYVDLFFLLSKYTSVPTVVTDAKRKYQAMFDEKLFLEQLDYMDDIADLSVEFIGEQIAKSEVQQFLHDRVREYLQQKEAAL
jgi:predicted nucleotidyltransferase component of viral defense system